MTRLAPNLFDRRYDDLVELARASLPRLAPEWTDYNAHDPGITLIELLAFVTEAQLYALGRTSKAERLGYAALFGLAPTGTRPARGLLWPLATTPGAAGAATTVSQVLLADASARLDQVEGPRFHLERRVLFAPGRIVSLISRLSDGSARDVTEMNARGVEFTPLGPDAGPRDRLVLSFETNTDAGLFPSGPADARTAAWILGVRVANSPANEGNVAPADRLEVSLETGGLRFTLPLIEDTSYGLSTTGMLALDVSGVPGSPSSVRIELRAPRGLARAPRLLQIEPNVVPITQQRAIAAEAYRSPGSVDFAVELAVPGLCFGAPGDTDPSVEVDGTAFRRCDRLADAGPDDRVYELDPSRSRVSFGNGVNGARLAADAQVVVGYSVCDGAAGNVAAHRRWRVDGVAGVFGTNLDAIVGGADPTDLVDLRRSARQRLATDHALVSRTDIEAAALALADLEVARAWVAVRQRKGPDAAGVTLIAMREQRADAASPQLESARWLEAVRARLASRLPLGTRLVVRAPRYVDFALRAELEILAGRSPTNVERDATQALGRRLTPVKSAGVPLPRAPGVPVASRDVAAWLLAVPGVARVRSLALLVNGAVTDRVTPPESGFARLDLANSELRVLRPNSGGVR